MRYLSLFSGCGLLDLGLEAAGWEPVMFCERDKHCRTVLARHWPGVPVATDVREVAADTDLTGSQGTEPTRRHYLPAGGARVDLVVGGFPCQPVSYAGQRQAQLDDRWLWPEMARVVRALRPRLVLVENVPGLATAGLGDVIGDLAAAGYVGEWFRVRASDVGAPHKRERLFIVAALADTDSAGWREPRRPIAVRPEQPAAERAGATAWGDYEPAIRRWESLTRPAPAPTDEKGRLMPELVEWMMGAPDGWTDGVSRTQRLKMLGNGVQVQVGELLGHAMKGVL